MRVCYIYGRNYDSNIFVILGEKPTIVDCGTGLSQEEVAEDIKKIIDPKTICQIIITHEHFDHCGGVKMIHGLTKNAKIMAHIDASGKMERGRVILPRCLVHLCLRHRWT